MGWVDYYDNVMMSMKHLHSTHNNVKYAYGLHAQHQKITLHGKQI